MLRIPPGLTNNSRLADDPVDQMVHLHALGSRSIGFRGLYQRMNNLSTNSIHWRMPSSLNMVKAGCFRLASRASDAKDEQVKRVTPPKPIRVLPMNIPNLLFDMIKRIVLSTEDLRFVGEPTKWTGILRAAAATKADVIILSDKDMSADNCYRVLHRRPHLKIIAISADGRRGSLYELRPRAKAIRDLSAENLIAAIRGGASFGGGSAVARK